MIRVRISSQEGVKALEFEQDRIEIGRGDGCTIKIDDKKASRQHAVIEVTAQGAAIRDLDSRNGTFLNTNRIQNAVLAKGDVIKIGDTFIYIDQVPEAKSASAVELKAVPVEEKVQVKEKIEEARKAIKKAETQKLMAVYAKIVKKAAMVAVPVLLIGGLVYFVASQTEVGKGGGPAPTYVKPKNEGDETVARGREALNALKAEVEAAPFPTEEHIKKCLQLQTEYAPWFVSQNGISEDPFQAFLTQLYSKRLEYFTKQFEAVRNQVMGALNAKHYRLAVEALLKFSQETRGELDHMISELKNEIDTAAQSEYNDIEARAVELERMRRYSEVARLYEEALSRFKDTVHYSDLRDKAEIAREKAGLASQNLAAKTEKYDWKPEAKSAPKDPAKDAPQVPVPQATLNRIQQVLANAINDKRLTRMKLDDGKWVTVTRADPVAIETAEGKLDWSAISPGTMANALFDVVRDEDLLMLAQYCHANRLEREAARALYKYAQADPKGRKTVVEDIVATWKGLSAPPEGGYEYNAKLERWEDVGERKSGEAIVKVKELAERIARASSSKTVEENFKKAMTYYNDPVLSAEARAAIKSDLVAALREQKEKRLEEIKQKARSSANSGLPSQARLLEERRKECLRVMYDTNIYYPEGHPKYDEGLKAYRKVRDALLEVWNGKASMQIDPSLREAVLTVNKTNEEYLKQLGETAPADELKDLEEVLANASNASAVTLQKYALTRKQRDIYDYNERVDRYNNGTFKTKILPAQCAGAPADIIEQVNVLNAYREALGRRKLFLDARLVRAAQKHSRAQAAEGRIWHVGPDGNPSSRAQAEGFNSAVGENCAIGYGSPQAVHLGWDEASDHCRNQCSDTWNCIGVGHAGSVWTQNFGVTTPPPEVGR